MAVSEIFYKWRWQIKLENSSGKIVLHSDHKHFFKSKKMKNIQRSKELIGHVVVIILC